MAGMVLKAHTSMIDAEQVPPPPPRPPLPHTQSAMTMMMTTVLVGEERGITSLESEGNFLFSIRVVPSTNNTGLTVSLYATNQVI